ncbi:MAG: lipid biosynthesis lauroyl acyltransferase [Phenylobacterium sp.]|nr:lipid biosynthesis lauroyl acyltransferase [Phenylobacterium sp.]
MAQQTPSRAQDLLWRLEAAAFDAFNWLARRLPMDVVSDFGAWLVGTLGPLTSVDRTAERNLRIAFPDAPAAEIARLKALQWREAGRFFAEFPILDRIVGDPSRVEVINSERLAALVEGSQPAVLISGHFSNFEVMSAVIVHSGVRCQVTYRAANNPYIDKRFRENRARYGVQLFAPKGTEGARALMRAFGRGESVALLNDQKFNGGVAAPFFGVPAYTAPGPATFALKFGAPILPMSVQRIRKARFRVIVHEPIVLEDTGDRTADIEAGVRRINAFMEARVRERPHEWFWVHKRWPNEMYKKG